MGLLRFISPPELLCPALPSSRYLFHHLTEHEHAEDCVAYDIEVQISLAPWSEQILKLFKHVKLEDRDGIRKNPQELLMHSYLIPITTDAKQFRDQMTNSSSENGDIGGGFVSCDRARSHWTYRDTTLCESWLIDLHCDDKTVTMPSKRQG